MNAGTSTPVGEAAMTRLVVALEWLFEDDDQWRPVPSPDGAMITLRRCRAATVDTIVMSPDTTYAVRTDAQGQQVDQVEGTAVLVVAAVGGWPVPGGSDGPAAVSGPRP